MPRQRVRREVDLATGEVFEVQTSAEFWLPEGYRLRADTRRGGPEARVEFSVPRMLHGDNRLPASPEDVVRVVQKVHSDLSNRLTWMCPAEDLEVVRVDLARDFEAVDGAAALLRDLFDERGLRSGNVAYGAPSGGVQTLERPTTRWRGRLYDRHAHYMHKARGQARDEMLALAAADRGVVRFELELKGEEARRRGIDRVTDLLTAPLRAVAEEYFYGRCRFGRVVAGPRLQLQAGLDALLAAKLKGKTTAIIGQLLLDAYGFEPTAHAKTADEYRGHATRAGLTPGDLLRADRRAVRLDFARGTVVPVPSG
ncbi:hypothetical protein [Cellulomonas carbonis]|nr:hypothetical protein [Cellulomonas carbonis]